MKPNHKTLTILLIFAAFGIQGQSSLDLFLKKVEEGSSALTVAERRSEAEKIAAMTGLAPENPQVEFAYLWGSPQELGERMDLSVTQTFDFPTAYISRSRLSKIRQHQAELEYEVRRQEIISAARKTWAEGVYLNRVDSILNGRLDFARKMLTDYERKMELGEIDRLKLNQVRMNVIMLENELSQLERERHENDTKILTLTGGEKVMIKEKSLPTPVEILIDSLILNYKNGPSNQLYLATAEKKAKEVDVTFDMKLPQLKAGYYRETILGTKLEGVLAGITIPLWGNARAVRSARANQALAETDAARYWEMKKNEIEKTYEQWLSLKKRSLELEQLLSEVGSENLLTPALENGEISLSEFYFESDYYFRNVLLYEEFRRDLYYLEVELLKVYY